MKISILNLITFIQNRDKNINADSICRISSMKLIDFHKSMSKVLIFILKKEWNI